MGKKLCIAPKVAKGEGGEQQAFLLRHVMMKTAMVDGAMSSHALVLPLVFSGV